MYQFIGKKGRLWELKFNTNCPESEKVGTGPGSCGGSKESGNTTNNMSPGDLIISRLDLKEKLKDKNLSDVEKKEINKQIKDITNKIKSSNPSKPHSKSVSSQATQISPTTKKYESSERTARPSNTDVSTPIASSTKAIDVDKPTSNVSISSLGYNHEQKAIHHFTGTRTSENATIYKNANNTTLILSSEINPNEVANVLSKIPKKLLNNLSTLEITGSPGINSTKDPIASILGINGYADIDKKTITIYNGNVNKNYLNHELAHQLDNSMSSSGYMWTKDNKEWENAIKSDARRAKELNGHRYVSDYANDVEDPVKNIEDFAESMRLFNRNKSWNESFKRMFPARTKIIERLLKE